MSKRTSRAPLLVLTCEHGGNRVPAAWRHLFAGAEALLASHRGWDPGALLLAKRMARQLRRPLLATTWSRLLVEANRSPTNPRIWSRFTKGLPRAERQRILQQYWLPHRQAVESAVATGIARGHQVVHVAVHSFTPELDGEVRNADVGLLFDSSRKLEAAFARRWGATLEAGMPGLRVRYNYPYRGNTDGLPTALRRRHPAGAYLGLELEVNQAALALPTWRVLGAALARSLALALAPGR